MAKPKVTSESTEMTSLRIRFLETVNMVERVRHQILDVIKDELDRRNLRMINGAQAMLLFKIGDCEMTATQLYERGDYLGSNLSYNLKKLTAAGYVHQERSQADRRSILVRLSEEGEKVRKMLDRLVNHHLSALEAVINVGEHELSETNAILDRLERWIAQPKYHDSDRLLRSRSPRPNPPGAIDAPWVL